MKLKDYISIFESDYSDDSVSIELSDNHFTIRLTKASSGALNIIFVEGIAKSYILNMVLNIDDINKLSGVLYDYIVGIGAYSKIEDTQGRTFQISMSNDGLNINSMFSGGWLCLPKTLVEELRIVLEHYIKTGKLYKVQI